MKKQQPHIAPAEARAIAKEAYIYGFPVDNYRASNTRTLSTRTTAN
jgi:hypothetical protein